MWIDWKSASGQKFQVRINPYGAIREIGCDLQNTEKTVYTNLTPEAAQEIINALTEALTNLAPKPLTVEEKVEAVMQIVSDSRYGNVAKLDRIKEVLDPKGSE